MEMSPYIHLPFKIAMSWSNGLGVKDVVKLCMSRVFAIELYYEF